MMTNRMSAKDTDSHKRKPTRHPTRAAIDAAMRFYAGARSPHENDKARDQAGSDGTLSTTHAPNHTPLASQAQRIALSNVE